MCSHVRMTRYARMSASDIIKSAYLQQVSVKKVLKTFEGYGNKTVMQDSCIIITFHDMP